MRAACGPSTGHWVRSMRERAEELGGSCAIEARPEGGTLVVARYRSWRTIMNPANEPIRILIADDHPIFRFGMRTLLTALADITVVGEAVTGEEAIQLTETLLPDLVLMDIHMPGINGIEATAAFAHSIHVPQF